MHGFPSTVQSSESAIGRVAGTFKAAVRLIFRKISICIAHRVYQCSLQALSNHLYIFLVREDLNGLKELFNKLRREVQIFLERTGITTKELCFILSDQPYLKINLHFSYFLREAANALANAQSIMAMFMVLNTHWDFMNSDILGHITSHYYHNSAVKEVVNKYEAERLYTEYKIYEIRLEHFLNFTTVHMFCEVEVCIINTATPPHLLEIISKHAWYPPVYLKDVDKFRRSLADHRNTPIFAAIIAGISYGSVILRLFVANTSEKICTYECIDFYEENDIVEFSIQGSLIYKQVTKMTVCPYNIAIVSVFLGITQSVQ